MTKQRQLIYDVVNAAPVHLTAEEIFMKAKLFMPEIAQATVYNNLNYLTDHGIIRRISILGENDRYDRNVMPHAHLVCDRCKEITDIEVTNSKWLESFTEKPITSYDLTLHYICDKCENA